MVKLNNSTSCPLCSASDVDITVLPYPLFRHMDFSPFHPGPNRISRCNACQLIFRITNDEEQREIDAIYCSETYLKHKEPHTLVIDGHDVPMSMSYVQARILDPYLMAADLTVLDIGCFDGMLLSEIDKVSNASDLCGFDVDERPQFPCGEKFRFMSGGLETINGLFDIIIMSHSIQYIRDIHELFRHFRRLLKPDGRVFVQVPDFLAKPCSLLLGDLYYHYNQPIMQGIFGYMGFDVHFLKNPYFPRDILVIASQGGKRNKPPLSQDSLFKTCCKRITEMADRLDGLGTFNGQGVLGTTIEAAFVSYYLGAHISFFVDENPKKEGTTFQGKPVLHPNQLTDNHHTILPYGKSGPMIERRFKKLYQGSFTVV